MLVLRLVPFTLFAPLAGAFVDRWSRRNRNDSYRSRPRTGCAGIPRGSTTAGSLDRLSLYRAISFFGAFFEAAKNAAVPNITANAIC